MIEVSNLAKKYGNHYAVDHISFSVPEGQILGLLGPNGAGKTTTMNIMTGYIAATEGQVVIDGHDIFEEPEAAKSCIGYLPEQPPLYLDMTPYEYLRFAAQLRGLDSKTAEERIVKVMKQTKILDMAGRLIKHLSKGYRQRVGLAQALIGNPKIIILDEPTVGLDPKQIIETRELIRSLAKTHTVILSSHILSEVSAVCDHILIISRGKLVASDTPENLSHKMLGASVLDVTAKGEQQQIRAALAGIPEISAIAFREDAALGTCRFTIESKEDVREAAATKLFGAGCTILSMSEASASLEDVFLELTSMPEVQEEQKPAESEQESDEVEQEVDKAEQEEENK